MTPRWPHVSAATVGVYASVESQARGGRSFVLLVCGFVPRCPRTGARSEEKGLMRRSSPRLWPRHHHVKEQATERHADRERIGQLASPPVPTVSVSFIDRNVPVKDAPGARSWHGPGGQDLARTGYPRWRSSAAHSPDSRRSASTNPNEPNASETSSASPTSSPLAITISGSDRASASRSHHTSKSGRSRFAATTGALTTGSLRRSCRET